MMSRRTWIAVAFSLVATVGIVRAAVTGQLLMRGTSGAQIVGPNDTGQAGTVQATTQMVAPSIGTSTGAQHTLPTGTGPLLSTDSNVGAILHFALPNSVDITTMSFSWGITNNGSASALVFAKAVLPFNCRLKNMYVAGTTNTTTNVTISLYVNNTPQLTVLVATGTHTGSQTVTTYDASAGDLLYMSSNAAWSHGTLDVAVQCAPR